MKSKIKILFASILTIIPSISFSQLVFPDSILQLPKYSVHIGSRVNQDTFYVRGGQLGGLPMKAKFSNAFIGLIDNRIHLEFILETSEDGEMLKEGIAIIGTLDSLDRLKDGYNMLCINKRVVASPDSSGKFKLDCVVNANDELLVYSISYYPRIYHIGKFIGKK